MAGPRQPRKKKTAPRAADGLRRPRSADELRRPGGDELRRQGEAEELRRQAEERLDVLAAAAASPSLPAPEELVAAVHELRVHQIELEMQNEELRHAQLELEEQREKYFALFDLAPVGYLTLSDKGMVGDANLTAVRLLGLERQLLIGQPFSAYIFAPDRDAYYLHLLKLMKTAAPQTFELRLQRVGDEPFWAHLEAQPQDDADGEPPRYHLTFTDVHERVLAEEALRESEAQYRLLAEHTSDLVWLMDMDIKTTYQSPSAEKLRGYTSQEIRDLPLEKNLTPESLRLALTVFSEELPKFAADPGYNPVHKLELEYYRKDGSTFWSENKFSVIRDGDGKPVSILGEGRDVTERKLAEKALARLNAELVSEAAALAEANATITRIAATDHLTGLASRRHFYESLEKAISLARRHGYHLALVSFDLDGLKRVNDSAGHRAGDEVLACFATLLAMLCRAEDLPGRLGGDEFCVLLPGVELDGGRGLAERVLAAVRTSAVLAERGITVSAGVAQWVPDEPPDDLLRRADDALYAAKRSGGDAVSGAR